MVNYQNGKVYKLIDNQTDKPFYVGSTAQSLSQRKGQHVVAANTNQQRAVYQYIRNINFNFSIVLIKSYPCRNKDELNREEGKWIQKLSKKYDLTNHIIAGRTYSEWFKQYYEENKDKILEYHQNYRRRNTKRINQYAEEYRKQHKDKINEYAEKYRAQNRDRINVWHKQNYEQNKDRINTKKGEKVECYCGAVVRRDWLRRHQRTKKHRVNYVNKFNHYVEICQKKGITRFKKMPMPK